MQTYLVGGAVRDALLGRKVVERDYVIVGATPEQLIKQGYQQVGKDFPVFLHPTSKEEYALARMERKQGQGYTGFICDFSPQVTLEQDLIRRDLTVNAIAQDETGALIDPYHGQQDLNNKILRHVSTAFSEDPLRILRVARFAARYHYLGFSIAPETIDLMTQMVAQGELQTLTKERIWLEIEKTLNDGSIDVFSEVLIKINGLETIIPGLQSLWDTQYQSELRSAFAKLTPSHNEHTKARFCLWLKGLEQAQINALAEHIRLPNEYLDALKLFSKYHGCFNHSITAESVLELLNQADVWRRPERMALFLFTLRVQSQQANHAANQIEQAMNAATTVDVQSIIKQGFKGPEIKHQLNIRRLQAISEQLD